MRNVFQDRPGGAFKTRVTLPDGRARMMGCGSCDREHAEAMAGMVAFLKTTKRMDLIEAVVDGRESLPRLYDRFRKFVEEKAFTAPDPKGTVAPELQALMAEYATEERARVYAIRNRGNGCIKIGWAYDPTRRVRELATAHSERLELLGSIPGGRELEKNIHYHFGDHRTNGEWFKPHPDIIAWVEECLTK